MPTTHAIPAPSYKVFFNDVWVELIDLPPVTDAALSKVLRGLRVVAPASARRAIAQMTGVSIPNLRAPFVVPPGTPLVAFPKENGCCDLIRTRYRGGPFFVDVGFATRIFSMRLTGSVRRPGETPLDTANRMLTEIFDDALATSTPVHFLQVNDADGLDPASPAYGCHDTSQASYSVHSPHWVDLLCWWLRPDELGFISMWGEGERKRAVESPSADTNRNWFSGKK